MLQSNIYKKSPVLLQNIFLTCRGVIYNFLRQGRTFKKIFSELESTQYYDKSGIIDWQNRRLNLLVKHAYKNVPYYNKMFKKLNISPDDIRSVEDLKKIPLLTKEDVRNNLKDLLDKNISRLFLHKVFTSGTSGKPLEIYRDIYSINFENAVLWRQRKWGGVDFHDRVAVLREEPVVPFNVKKQPFWRYSLAGKRLFLSIDHLSKRNTIYYVKALKDFKPVAIEAEPSSLYILSKFIKDQGISLYLPSVKAIFTSSEMLLEKHKGLIEEVFGVCVYDFYGNVERVAAMGTCEHKNYHLLPEYGITEFLPIDGESGKTEIISTGLHNYAMPLLRYRIGDIVQTSDDSCKCGRKFKVVKEIKGRVSDCFVCRDGRLITGFYPVFAGIDNIAETQVIQEDLDSIRIKFVPSEKISQKDKDKIISNVRRCIGNDIKIVLEEVTELLKNDVDKFRPFVSHVNGRHGV